MKTEILWKILVSFLVMVCVGLRNNDGCEI
jgi:hypothetical protein